MKIRIPAGTLFLFLLLSTSVAAQNASSVPSGEVALHELRRQAADNQAEGWFGLARLYSDESFHQFNPDSAYVFLQKAQSLYRRLSKGQQRRLERRDLDGRTLSRYKREILEKALDYAIQSGSSRSVDAFLSRYDRLTYELELRAYLAYNRLSFAEATAAQSYDSLLVFLDRNRASILRYSKNLIPEIEAKAFSFFFLKHEEPSLGELLSLLTVFPGLTAQLDSSLNEAFRQMPSVTYLEQNLPAVVSPAQIPLTISSVYPYYVLEGDLENLLAFNARYPFFIDSFPLRTAFSIARQAPDFSIAYTPDQRTVYENYIQRAAPRYRAFVALQRLLAEDVALGRWDEAHRTALQFRAVFPVDDARYTELLRILESPDPRLQPVLLGDSINTALSEYAPVLAADGQQLFFCRRGPNKEDIYVSSRQTGNWITAVPVASLNSPENEAPLGLSGDGTTLLLFDNGEVKTSEKEVDGWSAPVPFFPTDEESLWQGGTTLSSDRQVAIFAARRNDVIGLVKDDNIDLFLVFRQPDGTWSAPVNLGPTINTPFEDRSPFLHPDMRTLYFSSDGHGGLGGLDVFKTTRIGDSWTEWSAPVNLGKSFNHPGKNWGYKVSTDGSFAYFSADQPGRGSDIFRIDLPESLRPEQVFTIEGLLTDLEGQPLPAEIMLEDLSTGKPVGIFKSDPVTGSFFITLPAGRLYSYVIKAENHFPVSDNIDLRNAFSQSSLQTKISVPRIEEMVEQELALPLNNLFFATDAFEIQPESHPELQRLAQLLQDHQLYVEISGHTDNVGEKEYNLVLSQQRASAVRNFLIEVGCEPSHLSADGYGMERPVDTNDTASGRANNRRVEVRLRRINN